MFKSKKDKKEHVIFGGSSSYKEETKIQKSFDGNCLATKITRQVSTQSFSSATREEKSTVLNTVHSAGNIPNLLPGTSLILPNVRSESTLGSRPLLTGARNNEFGNNLNFPFSPTFSQSNRPTIPNAYRSAFNGSTFASYPSRIKSSPIDSTHLTSNIVTPTLPTSTEHIVPTYPNNCPKRGKVLIINNIKFLNNAEEERNGAKKDLNDLKKLFGSLKFDVEDKTDLKSHEMLKKIKQFSNSSFKQYDMSVVILMSHGSNTNSSGDPVRGGYTEIVGTDNRGLPTDDIVEIFTPKQCHDSLKGKPKIFIFQCCRGNKDEVVCTDAAPIKKVIKEHSDMLIAFSTLPGFVSNRDPKTGSWYIQSICEVFTKHHKDFHVEDMLKIVDEQLSKKHPYYKQTTDYINRGFKRCYLHPRTTPTF